MSSWKQAVARAFDGAEGYDRAAGVQARVAASLVERIAGLPLGPRPRVLEIGCGTGFLTRALRERLAPRALLATDIAPGMVARAKARAPDGPDLRYLVMDGERPCLAPGPRFDLIASSLAAQWFEDLPGAVAGLSHLLAPGGWLALATLAEGTFGEWGRAHATSGTRAATPAYPPLRTLRALAPPGCTLSVAEEPFVEAHPDGRAFLAALRAIGARTPGEGGRPLSPGALRRVLRSFEADGARVTYRVATCLVRREPGQAAETSTRMLPRVACE
ncbi:methyltransferase domain-containing protein [Methylobacterium durans]|uniref:SAM-dependent methyltransferase n=1 Tax=Methylobacterium durans TaxID=2202825 RepID=A0A2U8W621_9HYPH|nr:methyltransferase domain-containing protein [Methylobacterium durans]AWN41081.1 SAM-dependent methyltransferase [Methylobacterium durans]